MGGQHYFLCCKGLCFQSRHLRSQFCHLTAQGLQELGVLCQLLGQRFSHFLSLLKVLPCLVAGLAVQLLAILIMGGLPSGGIKLGVLVGQGLLDGWQRGQAGHLLVFFHLAIQRALQFLPSSLCPCARTLCSLRTHCCRRVQFPHRFPIRFVFKAHPQVHQRMVPDPVAGCHELLGVCFGAHKGPHLIPECSECIQDRRALPTATGAGISICT
mmetsp:Transcript_5421/g.14639  ORF Transcript_5421/g.14639 Transcript_5421/m.14639 type:complete len:213 (-) Transcript_5421:1974-2612(-)